MTNEQRQAQREMQKDFRSVVVNGHFFVVSKQEDLKTATEDTLGIELADETALEDIKHGN